MLSTRRMPASRRGRRPAIASDSGSAKSTGDRPTVTPTTKTVQRVFGRTEPTKREIRDRAYYIYLARGGTNGDPANDWIRAERELREEFRGTAHPGRRF